MCEIWSSLAKLYPGQSRHGAFISGAVFGNINILWDKKLQGKAVQVLLSVSGRGACTYQTNERGKKKPKQPNPNNLTCKVPVELLTCIRVFIFWIFCLLLSPLIQVAELSGALSAFGRILVQNCWVACAAGHEQRVQVFFPSSFRNEQFHLVVSSVFILCSPWDSCCILKCEEMCWTIIWKLPEWSQQGRAQKWIEKSPLWPSQWTLSWLEIYSGSSRPMNSNEFNEFKFI